MAYTAWSVVFGEQPTAAKWNQLGENDAGFKTGANIDTDAITTAKIPNRTRAIPMGLGTDNAGGATNSNTLGMPAAQFAGTPTSYMRCSGIIPEDYVAGTDIVIRIKAYASNTNAAHSSVRYVNVDAVGDSLAPLWDVDSAVTTTNLAFTANILKEIDITVAAANCSAGALVSLAWRISTAITGTLWVESVSIRYTADS